MRVGSSDFQWLENLCHNAVAYGMVTRKRVSGLAGMIS